MALTTAPPGLAQERAGRTKAPHLRGVFLRTLLGKCDRVGKVKGFRKLSFRDADVARSARPKAANRDGNIPVTGIADPERLRVKPQGPHGDVVEIQTIERRKVVLR